MPYKIEGGLLVSVPSNLLRSVEPAIKHFFKKSTLCLESGRLPPRHMVVVSIPQQWPFPRKEPHLISSSSSSRAASSSVLLVEADPGAGLEECRECSEPRCGLAAKPRRAHCSCSGRLGGSAYRHSTRSWSRGHTTSSTWTCGARPPRRR